MQVYELVKIAAVFYGTIALVIIALIGAVGWAVVKLIPRARSRSRMK